MKQNAGRGWCGAVGAMGAVLVLTLLAVGARGETPEEEAAEMIRLSFGAPPEELSDGLPVLEEPVASEYDVPVVLNEAVRTWLRYFLGGGRSTMTHWLARAGDGWAERLGSALAEAGLPRDLIWLAMIESGFNPAARSRIGAVGLWQIMPSTGVALGLRVDDEVDERLDPDRSTEAALRLLKELHGRFDDWYLALAAYNGGPTRVDRAIAATGSRDFWVLAEDNLPAETANFVPKFLAATLIARHPERYGFTIGTQTR